MAAARQRRPASAAAAAPLLLAVALLLAHPPAACALDLGSTISGAVGAVKNAVGGGSSSAKGSSANGGGTGGSSARSFGPIVDKSAVALQYAALSAGTSGPQQGPGNTIVLPLGSDGNVTLHRSGPHSVVLAFEAAASLSGGDGAAAQVPFLGKFLATSEAPAALVESFGQLVEGPSTEGALADAVQELMGGVPLLRVLCTGQGAGGGGLALLCGPWAALQYTIANADVISFGASWAGFNTQFSWSFAQLATLHYQWPFDSSDPALAQTSSGGGGLAEALGSLITTDSLKASIAIPNLPSSLPPDYSPSYTGQELGSLAPPTDPDLEPPPSECPLILCKTRDATAAACFVFEEGGTEALLPALPTARLQAANGADAVVAWNENSSTGIIIWQGSEEKIDWFIDALLFFSDDFRPGNLSVVIPGVKVHTGFLKQFESFTTDPSSDSDNITSVLLGLSGGKVPERILAAGHSLGAALSELTGVWASTIWPSASVLVANTGAPRVGDDAWEMMFTAVVGRAYRKDLGGSAGASEFVSHLDQVPVLPPFDSFKQVPHGIWLRDNLVLLQDRPPLERDQTTWDDHHCDTLYVPQILNASAVTVPGFVFNVSAA